VQHGGIELLELIDERISAIVMCAVFEHLVDHNVWLERFNRLLPINGYVVTLHPTAACYRLLGNLFRLGNRQRELPELHGAFFPPWHTAFFSLKGMKIIAERQGFEVVDIRPASQGNLGGLFGFVQKCLQLINIMGFKIVGLNWPLITSHVFVLKKIREII
jgi:hypothetical protein